MHLPLVEYLFVGTTLCSFHSAAFALSVNLLASWEEICLFHGPHDIALLPQRDRTSHAMSEIPPMKRANLQSLRQTTHHGGVVFSTPEAPSARNAACWALVRPRVWLMSSRS
jgi:hypothetical protein